jgi:outer membrane biosynthesis protein TonB
MIENIVIGNLSFSKAEAIVILDIEFPNPTTRMVQQFFAALLNTLKGADPADIDQTMVTVGEWLIIHPPGIDLTEAEIIEVDAMAEVLEAHNTGITGPGHCADEPFTPTPEATPTSTTTNTSTPAPVRTVRPRTPTPTKDRDKPKPTQPPATSPPTQPPPTNTPQPQPTQPQPTNTPMPRLTPTLAPTPSTP